MCAPCPPHLAPRFALILIYSVHPLSHSEACQAQFYPTSYAQHTLPPSVPFAQLCLSLRSTFAPDVLFLRCIFPLRVPFPQVCPLPGGTLLPHLFKTLHSHYSIIKILSPPSYNLPNSPLSLLHFYFSHLTCPIASMFIVFLAHSQSSDVSTTRVWCL